MTALFSTLAIVGLIGLALYLFGGNKIQRRIRARSRDAATSFANGIGNVVDDRKEKIHTAEERVNQFRDKVARVAVQINKVGDKAKRHIAEANKYADMANIALDENDDDTARACLQIKKEFEDKAQALLIQIDPLEKQYNNLKEQLQKAEQDIDEAKHSTVLLEARYTALSLRAEMQEASTSLGSIGSLDFSADDQVLDDMESQLEANNNLKSSHTHQGIRNLEAKIATKSIDNELEALKATRTKNTINV